MLIFAHWMACLFRGTGSFLEARGEISWIQKEGLHDTSKVEQYVNSMYWSITTMTTVGYGDIKPT